MTLQAVIDPKRNKLATKTTTATTATTTIITTAKTTTTSKKNSKRSHKARESEMVKSNLHFTSACVYFLSDFSTWLQFLKRSSKICRLVYLCLLPSLKFEK